MQTTTANPYRRRYNLLAFGSLMVVGVMAVLVLVLVFHHKLRTALYVGAGRSRSGPASRDRPLRACQ